MAIMATTVHEDFEARTSPFRLELLAHCYRMLGSVHDAEDQVQETLIRAWRSYDRFDAHRASMRTWLYRIATNACLTALESRNRRPLPSGLGAPGDDPTRPLVMDPHVPWLEPFPTPEAESQNDPASVLINRRGLRLAFVAAVQFLPARQRAVLILRDVLDWSAIEVAEMLDMTPTAVNSMLLRARTRLEKSGVNLDEMVEPADPKLRAVVDRYFSAFTDADIPALKQQLIEDAVLEMPPFVDWFVGREHIGVFIERLLEFRGTRWRVLPTSANGQPTVGAYVWDDVEGVFRAHSLQVFDGTATGIARNTVFQNPDLFEAFGLPALA
jgi:RNA polymerase sigma-70 factor (ECF subfamily)